MGLSASMWTSVSGLLAHGEKMNVVGNNIANVSTIGFKGQRVDFNDYLYINGGSTSGPTQIGAGVSTYAVIGDFSQGSLESTNSVTDLAIDGNGYFKVRQPNTEQMYYTRAGDFYFNADRQLQNPEGYRLQGWKVDSTSSRITFQQDSINLGASTTNESAFQGTGTPTDIVLDSWYLEPKRTDSISFVVGLTSDKNNDLARGADGNGPLLGLAGAWDGANEPPLPDKNYAYSTAIKVYDESGLPHTMTTYYDQVTLEEGELADLPPGYSVYEYIVTMDPADDKRYWGSGDNKETFAGTKAAGLVMTGHMIFDPAGNLVNQSAYTYQPSEDGKESPVIPATPASGDTPATTESLNLGNWKAAQFSSNGLPVFTANFKGLEGASSSAFSETAQEQLIEIDFGLRSQNKWGGNSNSTLADLKPDNTATITKNITSSLDTATKALGETGDTRKFEYQNPAGEWVTLNAAIAATLPSTTLVREVIETPTIPAGKMALFGGNVTNQDVIRNAQASQAGSSSFVTQDATQNGYASGILSSTNITSDGVVYGYYDNGKTIPLYQIALYDFHNEQGLRREGGNLYAATEASGEARQGVPGDNGFGQTRAYNIEGSNVDLSREFVNMITTQRGFQANSKGITTVDTMLETVIGMKR
ncbi:MAG: flagellar hook-basal body complex protein [Desulfovibrio sp.]|nr:flagellar hook-basal body complex protein [Desulfovibrio sp.]